LFVKRKPVLEPISFVIIFGPKCFYLNIQNAARNIPEGGLQRYVCYNIKSSAGLPYRKAFLITSSLSPLLEGEGNQKNNK
jgi:hypothetical protein